MPELPDLVHVEAGLRAAVVGKRIAAARTGDPTVLRIMVSEPFPTVLVGRTLEGVERRGHFMRFAPRRRAGAGRQRDAGRTLPAGGAGRETAKKDPRALGLALAFDDAPELQYLDDKRMGKVYVARAADEGTIPIYGQLGIDVLSPAFTRDAFGKLIAKRRDQVRAFLMDKRTLASIGNAYADEILFAAGLHPKTFCSKLAPPDVDALHAAIGRVLTDAIAEIRKRDEPIEVKVRDFLKVRGRDGKPCVTCGTTIRAVRVGDGDACFCPHCQRETRKLFVNWTRLNDAPAAELARPSHQRPKKNRAGRRDVERIGARRHRDGDEVVAAGARRRGQPRPLGAEQQREARRRPEVGQRRRARLDDGADDRDPVAAQRLEIARPRARTDDGQAEHRPERDADRLAVERIGAARGEDQRVRAERGGVARQRPQVVDVGEVLGHDQRRAPRGSGAGPGRSPIARQPRWT